MTAFVKSLTILAVIVAVAVAGASLLAGAASAQITIVNGQTVNRGQDFRGNANQPDANVTPPANVDVGGLIATTHELAKKHFLENNNHINRLSTSGNFIDDDELKAKLDDHIALMAPEVRRQGVVVAQHGEVALAGGEHIQLDFGTGNKLQGITAKKQDLDTHIENKHAIITENSLVILSATAVTKLRANIIKGSGQTVASVGANTVSIEGDRISLDDGATGDVQILGPLIATADMSKAADIQASPTPQNTAIPSEAKETTAPLDANRRIAARTTDVTSTTKLDVSGIGNDTVAMDGDLFLGPSNPDDKVRSYIAVDLHNYMRYGVADNAITDSDLVKPSGWIAPNGVISLKAAHSASVFNSSADINRNMRRDRFATAMTKTNDAGIGGTDTDAIRATAAEFTLTSDGYTHRTTEKVLMKKHDNCMLLDQCMHSYAVQPVYVGSAVVSPAEIHKQHSVNLDTVLTILDGVVEQNGTMDSNRIRLPDGAAIRTGLTQAEGDLSDFGVLSNGSNRTFVGGTPGAIAHRDAGDISDATANSSLFTLNGQDTVSTAGGITGSAPPRYVIFGDTGQYVVSRSWSFGNAGIRLQSLLTPIPPQ